MATGTLVQGALFTVMVVRAGMLRDPEFGRELAVQVERSPRFFRNAPVVLDLKGADGFAEAADFAEARDLLRERTLALVGVQNAEPAELAAAYQARPASKRPAGAPRARDRSRAGQLRAERDNADSALDPPLVRFAGVRFARATRRTRA